MITREDYSFYLGGTTPINFERLEFISIQTLKSIMVENIPNENDLTYKNFKKAVMEQMRYFELNEDLLDNASSGGYSLGSYNEGGSNQNNDNSNSMSIISPVSYNILLNCGLLYCGLGGV